MDCSNRYGSHPFCLKTTTNLLGNTVIEGTKQHTGRVLCEAGALHYGRCFSGTGYGVDNAVSRTIADKVENGFLFFGKFHCPMLLLG